MLGSILGAIAGPIVSGLFGKAGSDSAADAQRAANEQNIALSRETQERNAELQREFAQQGVRWKVADAQAAGIHPLFALGASTHSPAITSAPQVGPVNRGSYLAEMGQDVSRSVRAAMTTQERASANLQNEIMLAQVRKEHAMAQYYESAAARNSQQTTPPLPGSGIGEVPTVIDSQNLHDVVRAVPAEVTSRRRDEPHVEAGSNPAFMEIDTQWGPILVPRSTDLSESLENMWNPIVLGPTIAANLDRMLRGRTTDAIERVAPSVQRLLEALGRAGRSFRRPMSQESLFPPGSRRTYDPRDFFNRRFGG